MFGNDDGTDYTKLKEDRRKDREDTRSAEASFKLGIGNDLDKMLALVQGRYHAPSLPGEPDKITASIRPGSADNRKVSYRQQYDEDEQEEQPPRRVSYGAPVQKTAQSRQQIKYAEVVEVLESFAFSSDEARREQQVKAIVSAIMPVLGDLIVKEVAANTKSAFKKYAEKFYKIDGGIKAVFNFGGTKLSIAARGSYYGDEVIAVNKTDDGIVPMVMRLDSDGDLQDVSDEFQIEMGKA